MPVVLIPAHNEAAVLPRTLSVLLGGLRPDVEVWVLANGCSDETAALGREAGVHVLEVAEASKVAALNAGDAAAPGFPRMYLDADVELSGADANRIFEVLEQGAVAAEPRPVFDLEGADPLVLAWYPVWQALHGARPGAVGSGLYALSEEGRGRFGEFPKVIADDGFVRAHFAPGEIVEVAGTTSRVRAPRRLAELIKIKSRSRLGNLELRRRFPELMAARAGSGVGAKAAKLPMSLWANFPLYALVQLRIRRRAKIQSQHLDDYVWERDESSRGG